MRLCQADQDYINWEEGKGFFSIEADIWFEERIAKMFRYYKANRSLKCRNCGRLFESNGIRQYMLQDGSYCKECR